MPQFKHYKQRNVQPGGRQGALISAWVDLAMRKHKFLNVKRMIIAIVCMQVFNTGANIYLYFPDHVHKAIDTGRCIFTTAGAWWVDLGVKAYEALDKGLISL